MEQIRSFLAAIVASSDDAIIGLQLDGRIISWNSGAETIYGYKKTMILGQSIARLVLPERSDEVPHILGKIRQGERIRHFETMHVRQDGRVIYVSLSVSPVLDDHGHIVGASSIARDVTERIQTEEQLRQAESKYRLLFDVESDAILIFDSETQRLIDFNNSALLLYGYGREDFSHLHVGDLVLDGNLPEVSRHLATERDVQRLPLTHHRRHSGTLFPAEVSASAFTWKGRECLVCIVRDVSDRQRMVELSHSLALARQVQQHLLPQSLPRIPGIDLFAGSHSCEDVGGDYYDFFPMHEDGEDCWGVTVGDVSGHGVGAALLMSLAKGVLHANLEHHETHLEDLFQSVNRQLLLNTDDASFMTLFVGVLHIKQLSFRWNSAGHGPVYHFRSADRRIEELVTTGVPLGICADKVYPSHDPVQLVQGDILLIGTDGLWEARNPSGKMFGVERLKKILCDNAQRPAVRIFSAIMGHLTDFCGARRLEDDVTLVVMKVQPEQASPPA